MKSKLIIILMTSLSIVTYGQVDNIKEVFSSKNGKLKMIIFDSEKNAIRENESYSVINRNFNLSNKDSLIFKSKTISDNGIEHTRYSLYYSGIKVEGAEIIVHTRLNTILSINGHSGSITNVNTYPVLDGNAAIDIAKKHLKIKKLASESPEMVSFLKRNGGDSKAILNPTTELVLWSSHDSTNYRLSYKFILVSFESYGSYICYVDANNGNVLEIQSQLLGSDAIGTATTRYSGAVSINTSYWWPWYQLKDNTRGQGIQTWDCNVGLPANAIEFCDTNNTWDEWNNSEMDDAGLDAHFGAQKSYDYFMNVHDRYGFDGSNSKLDVYVHYLDPSNPDPNNAFWDKTSHTILCGDGDGVIHAPETTLDVIGHEFGHGVTHSFVSSMGSWGEEGSINEGLSDIWGARIKEYANISGDNMWIHNEEGELISDHRRNLANPNANHYHIVSTDNGYPYADTYLGTGWYPWEQDRRGAHRNSLVLSHWFYLLSHGDVGETDFGNQYIVSGIGSNTAAWITYELYNYLTSGMDYYWVSYYLKYIAASTYGNNSNIAIQVNNAWYAVGIGAEATNIITGGNYICTSATLTYSLPPEFEGAANITWSKSNNISILSGQGTRSITVTKNENYADGAGYITAVYNHGSGSKSTTINVWVGVPDTPTIYPVCDPLDPYRMDLYDETYINIMSAPTTGYWTSVGACQTQNLGSCMYVYAAEEGGTVFWVSTSNECGSSPEYFGSIQVGQEEYKSSENSLRLELSPNPSANFVDINLIGNRNLELLNNYIIEIIDSYSRIIKSFKLAGSFNRINTQSLSVGYYFIRLRYDKTVTQKMLIIKR